MDSPSSSQLQNAVSPAESGHVFASKTFSKVVICKVCTKQVWGFSTSAKKGSVCKVCLLICHKKCESGAAKKPCTDPKLLSQYEQFVLPIRDSCLKAMQRLLWQCQEGKILEIPKKYVWPVMRIMQATPEDFNVKLGEDIEKTWRWKDLQRAYEKYSREWQIQQGVEYFFEHATRIGHSDYKPNSQDAIRTTRPENKAKDYKQLDFVVWLHRGEKVVFSHDPDRLLSDLLKEVATKQRLTDPELLAWDAKTCSTIAQTDIKLQSLNTLEIYYYPKGKVPFFGLSSQQKIRSKRGNQRGSMNPFSKKGGASNQEINTRNGTLVLVIGSGKNLATACAYFESLYIILSSNFTDKQIRSQLVPCQVSNENPSWNQTFKFNVNSDLAEFSISVWAKNRVPTAADVNLGQLSVLASGYKDGSEKAQNYKLKGEPKAWKKKEIKDVRGELHIKWRYADYKRKATEKDAKIFRHVTQRVIAGKTGDLDLTVTSKEESSNGETPKKLEDVYEIGDELGSGAFSIVREGTNKETGSKAAIKIMDNYRNLEDADEELESFNRETGILFSLNHPNIVRLYDVFEDEEHAYVVMELVQGGELFDQIVERGSYEEDECKKLMSTVLDALIFLHGKGIAHRDLKPENLLFTSQKYDTLKIVDFGEAIETLENNLTDYVGTPDYMAPEILKGQPYGFNVDLWSFGVIVYVMLCGFPPFDGEDEAEILCHIMDLSYEFPSPDWDHVSDQAKNFISSLLTTQDKRMTAQEARSHPWMASVKS